MMPAEVLTEAKGCSLIVLDKELTGGVMSSASTNIISLNLLDYQGKEMSVTDTTSDIII